MTIKLSTLQVPKGRKNRQTTGTAQALAGVKEAERGLSYERLLPVCYCVLT